MSKLDLSASPQLRKLLIALLANKYLLSVKELSEFLNCSYRVAWKLITSGRIYSKEIGKTCLIYIEDIFKAAKSDPLVHSYLLKVKVKEAQSNPCPQKPALFANVICPYCGFSFFIPKSRTDVVSCPVCKAEIYTGDCLWMNSVQCEFLQKLNAKVN